MTQRPQSDAPEQRDSTRVSSARQNSQRTAPSDALPHFCVSAPFPASDTKPHGEAAAAQAVGRQPVAPCPASSPSLPAPPPALLAFPSARFPLRWHRFTLFFHLQAVCTSAALPSPVFLSTGSLWVQHGHKNHFNSVSSALMLLHYSTASSGFQQVYSGQDQLGVRLLNQQRCYSKEEKLGQSRPTCKHQAAPGRAAHAWNAQYLLVRGNNPLSENQNDSSSLFAIPVLILSMFLKSQKVAERGWLIYMEMKGMHMVRLCRGPSHGNAEPLQLCSANVPTAIFTG